MDKIMTLEILLVAICAMVTSIQAWVEVPKFHQMQLLYPGYLSHGGQYKDNDVLTMLGLHDHTDIKTHNTASLRLSIALNKYGGRHAIGTEAILLSKRGRDSVPGHDNQQYIFRNTAFGPFLADKYGNPDVKSTEALNEENSDINHWLSGRQGVVRLVSYQRHASGHVALWDCDHFHQSRDFTADFNIISVEFWISPDSYCPPQAPTPAPKLVMVAPSLFHQLLVENVVRPAEPKKVKTLRHFRHKHRNNDIR